MMWKQFDRFAFSKPVVYFVCWFVATLILLLPLAVIHVEFVAPFVGAVVVLIATRLKP